MRVRERWRRLRLVHDFRLFELLTASRLDVGLRVFRTALGVLVGAGAVVGIVLVVAVLVLLDRSVPDGRLDPYVPVACFVVAVVTVCGQLVQETFTQKRFVVGRSANAALFRALDVDAADVWWVYRAVPLTGESARAGVLCVVALVVTRPPAGARAGIACAAVLAAGLCAALATSAGNARTPTSAMVPRRWWAAVLVAVAGLVGAVVGGFTAVDAGTVPRLAPVTWWLLAAAGTTVGVVAGATSRSRVRQLRTDSFRLAADPGGRSRRDLSGASGRRAGGMSHQPAPLSVGAHLTALTSHVRRTWQADSVVTIGLVVALVVAFTAGVRAVRARPLDLVHALGLPASFGSATATLSAITVSILVVELMSTAAGPARMASHHRSAWELGASAARVAVAQLVLVVVPAALAAAAVTLVLVVLGGPVDLGPLTAATGLTAATVAVDCLLPPPRNVDGSTTPSGLGLVLSLVLAAPGIVLAFSSFPARGPVGVAYVALLLTGAWLCIVHRITHHPSSSSASTPAMSPVVLSSRGSTSASTDRGSSASQVRTDPASRRSWSSSRATSGRGPAR